MNQVIADMIENCNKLNFPQFYSGKDEQSLQIRKVLKERATTDGKNLEKLFTENKFTSNEKLIYTTIVTEVTKKDIERGLVECKLADALDEIAKLKAIVEPNTVQKTSVKKQIKKK